MIMLSLLLGPKQRVDVIGALDNFTTKLHINDHFETNPKTYANGQVRYVDNCDVDQLNIIKFCSMFNEAEELSLEADDEAGNDVNEENEHNKVGSFYDDISNVDNTDEEVCNLKEKRRLAKEKVVDVGGEKFWNGDAGWTDWINQGDGNDQVMSDLSDCDDSDFERWVANSTDDEDV
ncbi:hypothetical protein AgCh_039335 [Apium graveolens]